MSAAPTPGLGLPARHRRRLVIALLVAVTAWVALVWMAPTNPVPTPIADVHVAVAVGIALAVLALGAVWLGHHTHPLARLAHAGGRAAGGLLWSVLGGLVLAVAGVWALVSLGLALAGGALALALGHSVPAPDAIGLAVLPERLVRDPAGLFGPRAAALGVGVLAVLVVLALVVLGLAWRHGRLWQVRKPKLGEALWVELRPQIRVHGIRGPRAEWFDLPHHLLPHRIVARRRWDGILVQTTGLRGNGPTYKGGLWVHGLMSRTATRLLSQRFPRRALPLAVTALTAARSLPRKFTPVVVRLAVRRVVRHRGAHHPRLVRRLATRHLRRSPEGRALLRVARHPRLAATFVRRAFVRTPRHLVGLGVTAAAADLAWRLEGQPAESMLCGEVTTRGFLRDRRWLVVTRPHTHSCVIGPSGVGKGISAMLPPLLSTAGIDRLGWPGPIVASSAKGDLLLPTIAWRKTLGKVSVWSPLGDADLGDEIRATASECMVGWNPAAEAVDESAAVLLAGLFVPMVTGNSPGNSAHFSARAAQLLAPLLRAACIDGAGMGDVVGTIARISIVQDGPDVKECISILQGTGEPGDAGLAAQLRAVDSAAKDERSGIMGTATRSVAAFGDAKAARAAGGGPDAWPPLDLDAFLDGRNTLFVVAPADPAVAAMVRPVVVAFLGRVAARAGVLARENGGALALPLKMLNDECSVVGGLADLPASLAVSRSLNIHHRHCWQDLAQQRAEFGDKAASALSNSQCLMIFPGSTDDDVLKLVGTLTGSTAVSSRSISRSPGSADDSESIGQQSAEVVSKSAGRTLPAKSILVVADTRPALLVNQVIYHEHQIMGPRSGGKTPGLLSRVGRAVASPWRVTAGWMHPLR